MAADLRTLIAQVNPILEEEIRRIFSEVKSQAASDDPWSERILEMLEAACVRPGKLIRPTLVAIGASAVTEKSVEECWNNPDVVRAMVLIQLLHKRLLLADDIADRDEVRNDEPAFHIEMEDWMKQNEPYSHLSRENQIHFARSYSEVAGIWLQQIITTQLVSLQPKLPQEKWQQLAADFNRYAYEITVAGWLTLLDQSHEVLTKDVSRPRFLRGLYQVTGGYSFTASLLLGTAFGEISADQRDVIIQFGEKVGILFQLRDDTLGIFGDPAVTGKPVGGDVREGKKTLYVQEAMQRSSAEDQARLQSLVGKPDITQDEVEWVRELVLNSGANDAVEATIAEYQASAHEILKNWQDEETLLLLSQLVEAVANRKK